MANGRCRMHNGGARRGLGASQIKTGRYSKDLPTRLAAAYDEAISDPVLSSVRDEVALVQSRVHELLDRLRANTESAGGDLGRLWKDLYDEVKSLRNANDNGFEVKADLALGEVERLVKIGSQDSMLWTELGDQIDRLSRMRHQEHKRLVDMQLMVTTERAQLMMGALISIMRDAVAKRVDDDKVKRQIYGDISVGFERTFKQSAELIDG